MPEYEYYYTHYLEGYEKAFLVSTGANLGIRETRRIIGEYILNTEDYEKRASFDDEIGRYCYPIDLHPVEPGVAKTKYEEDYTKGLLVAGRCISTSREMNGSTRVMPCCFITGMAAGAAAAFSKDSNVRAVSVSSLRRELRKRGAYLPE